MLELQAVETWCPQRSHLLQVADYGPQQLYPFQLTQMLLLQTSSPAMAMSSSSFGGLRPSASAPAPDENIYEEPHRRAEGDGWRQPGDHFVSILFHCLYVTWLA